MANPLSFLPFDWPYLIFVPALVLVVWIVYVFFVRPRVEYPLPNEQDEGFWRIPLPQLGRMNEGRVTTARRYSQNLWSKVIENNFQQNTQKLVEARDALLRRPTFAQKVGRDKVIYLFDQNPLDPQFHMREDKPTRFGTDIIVRFVYGVKDCKSLGTRDGFEFIGVKLSKETSAFQEEERALWGTFLEVQSYLRLAAVNLEALQQVKKENSSLRALYDETLGILAKERSELNIARRALGQKDLWTGEAPMPKTPFLQTVTKGFFTWIQLAITLLTYVVAYNAAKYYQVMYPDPATFSVILAVAAFFGYPIAKGLLQK